MASGSRPRSRRRLFAFEHTSNIGGHGMAPRRKDLEAENEELWQRLEDLYDRLGDLFEPEGDVDGLDEDE